MRKMKNVDLKRENRRRVKWKQLIFSLQSFELLLSYIHGNYIIVTRDMVWKLGELQSVYNELQFNVETASPYVHKSFEILLINISIQINI